MKHLIIGTAGHVDHGKTSLVRLLTGIDCDTHNQEKQRGITINLGFTHLDLPNGESAGIIDVPGHKDFINTMIGGACGIDMVLLVIAADSGIMPQTTEHLEIIRSLGVKNGVIALTRADLVDAELLEMAQYEVVGFLEGTPLEEAPIIPVSSVTGLGKEELISAITATLDKVEPRPAGPLFRMYIDRIFTVKGHGSVVTGSVLNGQLASGSELFLLPSDQHKLRVRSIERHGRPVDQIVAGDRAAINLTGLNREDFDRGMILCDKMLDTTDMIDVSLSTYPSSGTLSTWSNIVLISGTFSCQARMHLLDKDSVAAGEAALAQIHLSKPTVLMNRDRFIIRNSSEDKTLGGGMILETSPLHHRKRTPQLIEELQQLARHILGSNSITGMIHVLLKKMFRPMTPDEVRDKISLSAEEIRDALAAEQSGYSIYRDQETTILINDHCDKTYRLKTTTLLQEHHRKNPLFAEGLNMNELSGKMMLSKSPAGKHYLRLLLNSMLAEDILEMSNNTFIIHSYQPQFDKRSLDDIAWLEQQILQCGDNKPVVSDLEEQAAARKIHKAQFRAYLSWLVSHGKVKSFKTEVMHASLFTQYAEKTLAFLAPRAGGCEIAEFKELTGGSKKFRTLLIDMLIGDELIRLEAGEETETRLHITPKGRLFSEHKNKEE
jgi:selenocysteine-specific elongation factor